jgi:prephenate dehydrogenase
MSDSSNEDILAPEVLIIGGGGIVGQWCGHHCKALHWRVTIFEKADSDDSLYLDTLLEQSTIVVLAVPLGLTQVFVDKLSHELRPQQLLIECSSVKSLVHECSQQLQCSLLSLHPLFSPSDEETGGIITFDEDALAKKSSSYALAFLDRLKESGNLLIPCSGGHHDKIMAWTQGVNHVLSLSLLETISRASLTWSSLCNYATPSFLIRMVLALRTVSQSPDLVSGILLQNPHLPTLIKACASDLLSLATVIEEKDQEALSALLDRTNHLFDIGKDELLALSKSLFSVTQCASSVDRLKSSSLSENKI